MGMQATHSHRAAEPAAFPGFERRLSDWFFDAQILATIGAGAYNCADRVLPYAPELPLSKVASILSAIERGDLHASEQLLPLVYDELRKLAAQKLAQEKPGQTLQATALVHEAYLRLLMPARGGCRPDVEKHWNSSGHFFAAAAEAMRRILIDQARHKQSERRGGGRRRQDIEHIRITAAEPSLDVLAVNEALERFEKADPLKARLVSLRYFAGLTIPEAADALGISSTTADRYWAYARAWLHAELKKNGPGHGS
jgi:RNA polymerase sigma factor (TIGR02999 family)